MIYIYLMNISNIETNIEKYKKFISEYRYKKTIKYLKNKNKALSIGSELLLNYGIKKILPNIDKPLIYKKDINGKLYFDNFSNLHFNLSHSGDYSVCAITDGIVGVDIEKIKNINLNISKRFFSPLEHEFLISSKNKLCDFFRLWVLKESYMKARGLGLKIGLKDFNININENIEVYEKGIVTNYSFYEFDEPIGYKLAVCKQGINDKVVINYVDIDEVIK